MEQGGESRRTRLKQTFVT